MTEVLYHDKYVTVYKELMTINKYYFPLATSKTILIQDIDSIALVNCQGVNHRWGTHPKHLNNWFPLDGERTFKKKFIEIKLKGRKVKPSITPQDPERCFQLLWQHFTKDGKNYVQECMKQSERHTEKETEVCQQEMMERQQEAAEETSIKMAEKKADKPEQAIEVENLD